MDNWDNRLMFEQFIYDYLVKRSKHMAAEAFRTETSLVPNIPPEMDGPEGFLLEWWSICFGFDFFREWVQVRPHERQGFETAEGGNAYQDGQLPMNAHAEDQLLDNVTPSIFPASSGESSSMASHVSDETELLFLPSLHQEVDGQLQQIILPYRNREELLTSTSRTETDNVAHASEQKVESLVQNTSKAENTAFNEETDPMIKNLLNSFWMFEQDQTELFGKSNLGESSRNMKDLLACGGGSSGMNEFAGLTSSALQDDDSESDTSDCSSNF